MKEVTSFYNFVYSYLKIGLSQDTCSGEGGEVHWPGAGLPRQSCIKKLTWTSRREAAHSITPTKSENFDGFEFTTGLPFTPQAHIISEKPLICFRVANSDHFCGFLVLLF